MSRRIALPCAVLLMALTAPGAVADPECFDPNGCRAPARMPAVIDPPPPPAADVLPPALPEETADAPAASPRAQAAAQRPRPQMVVDPAPSAPEPQEPRYSVDAAPRSLDVVPAPRASAAVRRPVRAPAAVPAKVREVAEAAPAPHDVEPEVVRPARAVRAPSRGVVQAEQTPPRAVYVVNQGPDHSGYGGPAIVTLNGPVHYDDGVAVPYRHRDPAWKLCQIAAHRGEARADCGPYSYHPYGAGGYRPLGRYGETRGGTMLYAAPSAKVIVLDGGED